MAMFLAMMLSILLMTHFPSGLCATAEEWKQRTIYQIITDRFALEPNRDLSQPCNVSDQTFCGGTWNSITSNLDYIQSMGFTAIWISPVHKNYDGPRTAYGDPYHGYWVTDISKLNDRFGTANDLKHLSDELHKRGMLFMVDIVVNHVASITTTPQDYSSFYFKKESQYHPYCSINYGDTRSEQQCWMGDAKVALMDVNTEDADVVSSYASWIKDFVREYQIDGLRLDAAKHIRGDFWPGFCKSSDVFCMGEVYEQDVRRASLWQLNPSQPTAGSQETGGNGQDPAGMDSILNFPLYWELVKAFAITGQSSTGALDLTLLEGALGRMKSTFPDISSLGNFLENHDVPRWSGLSVDPQSLFNAITFLYMSDGIPIIYYGLEQFYKGGADPANREALWPSGYQNTTALELIKTLNKLRKWMADVDPVVPMQRRRQHANEKSSMKQDHFNGGLVEKIFRNEVDPTKRDLVESENSTALSSQIVGATQQVMAIVRGSVIGVVTNIGSPPQNISFPVLTPYQRNVATTDILSCNQYAVGSDGIVSVEYSKGGRPIILVPSVYLRGSGFCGHTPSSLFGLQSGSAHGRTRLLWTGSIFLFMGLISVVV